LFVYVLIPVYTYILTYMHKHCTTFKKTNLYLLGINLVLALKYFEGKSEMLFQ
jgi:hypothetical protein